MKKLLSLLLVACMLACTVALFPMNVIAAEETVDYDDGTWTKITNADEFMAIGNTGKYYLANDIDFGHDKDTPVEKAFLIGAQEFTGIIEGNGYSLLNINITNGGDCSSFGYHFGGTLQNITIGAEDSLAKFTSTGNGNSAAAVVATGAWNRNYTATFKNVTVYAEVKNTNGRAGGFTGYGRDGAYYFENCKVYGTVDGTDCAAGFFADGDTSSDATFIGCENHSDVTSASKAAAGFFATNGGGGKNNMKFYGCANFGDIQGADWRAGGIVAQFSTSAEATLVVDHCFNAGDVTMTKTAGEGIAAGVVGGMGEANAVVSNVYNVGTVTCDTPLNAVAYEIAYAGGGSTHQVVNAFYLNAEGLACNANVQVVENTEAVADAKALLSALKASETLGAYKFVASTDANYAYPVLAANGSFSEGTQTDVDATNVKIASDDFSAFISYRTTTIGEDETAGKDIRFVIAAKESVLMEKSALYMTLQFKDEAGNVVAETQKNVATELFVYRTATGGGITYTADQGSVLFGLIVTEVPDGAWDSVTVALSTSSSLADVFVVGTAQAVADSQ